MSRRQKAEGIITTTGTMKARKADEQDAEKWRRFEAATKEFVAASKALGMTVTVGPVHPAVAKTTAKAVGGRRKADGATSRRK